MTNKNIAVLKESKIGETRVAITPADAKELINSGFSVSIEENAGLRSGFSNDLYYQLDCNIISNKEDLIKSADIVVKVKEPTEEECDFLTESNTLVTYLHLAANATITQKLLDSKCTAIAYETITEDGYSLPLLEPMSIIAGQLSIYKATNYLENGLNEYGQGILLGHLPGTKQAKVVIIGAGNVGRSALRIAVGLGAKVVILDSYIKKLQQLDQIYGNTIETISFSHEALKAETLNADILVGAILHTGASAEKIISRNMIRTMKKHSVFVDVSIDQGGCSQTSRPTSLKDPIYIDEGVIHYCVNNIPACVGKTASYALSSAVTPYIKDIATHGINEESKESIKKGVNIYQGSITNKEVAVSLNMEKQFTPLFKKRSFF